MGSILSTTGTFHYGNRKKKTGVCLDLSFEGLWGQVTKNPPPGGLESNLLLFLPTAQCGIHLFWNTSSELKIQLCGVGALLYMGSRLSGLHGKHLICWTILIVLRGFCPRTPINPWTTYVQEHEKWDATLFKRSLWHTRHCLFLPSVDLQQHSKTM